MYKNIFSLVVVVFLFSCNNNEADSSKNTSPQPKVATPKEEVKERKFFAWVNDLRVRAIPNLKERKIASLSEGEEMTFMNVISKDSVEAKLRGRKIKAPFYKIKTKEGVEGWVFAGALSSDPVEVQGYSVAIVFEESLNYESDDVAVIMSNADSDLVGYGIQLMYVSNNFKSVKIFSPAMLVPKAKIKRSLLIINLSSLNKSPNRTPLRSSLGISIPIVFFPGCDEILVDNEDMARAISSARPTTLLVLIPAAGTKS